MAGKTLGIIGCGRIGSRFLQKMRHFGFEKILICDPYLSPKRVEELGIPLVSRERLFRESDFITIHVALTDETRHLVNRQTLSLMKPTAYLVNTSRGPVVDHEALAEALRAKVIAGAGIDVLRQGAAGRHVSSTGSRKRHPHAAPFLVQRGCRLDHSPKDRRRHRPGPGRQAAKVLR